MLYAVRKGKKLGVFETWDECKQYVIGYKGAEYKKVRTIEEGYDYIDGKVIESKYFYAVRLNKGIGEIFKSWEECVIYRDEHKQCEYKKFKTEEEAKDFILGKEPTTTTVIKNLGIPTIYIDGSFKNNNVGFGVYMTKNGQDFCYRARTTGSLRNISGEIAAFCFTMHLLRQMNIREANIVYDYQGIFYWLSGEWKTKSKESEDFRRFYNKFFQDYNIKLNFYSCKSHCGNNGNNKADKLAKQGALDGEMIPLYVLLSERMSIDKCVVTG